MDGAEWILDITLVIIKTINFIIIIIISIITLVQDEIKKNEKIKYAAIIVSQN